MERPCLRCTAGSFLISLIFGCGGGAPTQEDMMRMAIRRPSQDEKPNDAVKATPQPTAVPANKPKPPPKDASIPAQNSTAPATPRPRPQPQPPAVANRTAAPAESSGNQDADRPVRVDQLKPDPQPLPAPSTATERRQRTIDNLRQIGQAMEAYVKANGRYPASAIHGPSDDPLLSWRVDLLPYLGYEDLHKQFDLSQSWDSEHNHALLDDIPPVYQSPDRLDQKTNYLVPVGSFTVFRPQRGMSLRRIEDGTANTVILVEVGDSLAVPWTSPLDYEVDTNDPTRGLGELRQDGFFVVFGGCLVRRVNHELPAVTARAIFSADGGESVAYTRISSPATAEPATSSVAPGRPVAHGGSSSAQTVSPSFRDTRRRRGVRQTERDGPDSARKTVPDAATQQQSAALYREVYQSRLRDAKSREDRQKLAKDLLRQAQAIDPASADRFVLLRAAKGLSAQAGDSTTAQQALDELVTTYDVDTFQIRLTTLQSLAKHAQKDADHEYVHEQARELLDQALKRDDFVTARRLHDIALDASRRAKNIKVVRDLAYLKRDIRTLETRFEEVKEAVSQLDNDLLKDKATLVLARYYCFHKGQWEKGLHLLAQSTDPRLQQLATADLTEPTAPEEQVRLADGWWRLAEDVGQSTARHIRERAVHWYRMALPQLPAGLLKSKVEIRLKDGGDRQSSRRGGASVTR